MKKDDNSEKTSSLLVCLFKRASHGGFLFFFDRFVLAIVVFSLIAYMDLSNSSYLSTIKNTLNEYSLPLKKIVHDVIEIPGMVSQYLFIKEENEKLRLQLDEVHIKDAILRNKEKELEELRDILNLKYKSNLFEFMEKVLGFDRSIYSSHLLISSTHQKTLKQSVVISSSALVGIIVSTYGGVARVLPITSKKIYVPVRTMQGEHLIINGTDDNEMESTEIRNNIISNLKVGETLYTSGEGGCYRSNIPVAIVTQIDKKRNKVFAKPMTNFDKLSFVWIIDPIIKPVS